MAQQLHAVQQLRLDLHADDAQAAPRLQDRLSELCRQQLTAILDEELTSHCPPGVRLRLPRLELDLGRVPTHRLEAELPDLLRRSLRAALRRHLPAPTAAATDAPEADAQAVVPALEYFLLHGALPWQINAARFSLAAALQQALTQHADAFLAALLRHGHLEHLRRRLAQELSPDQMLRLINLLEPVHAPFIRDYLLTTLATHRRQPLAPMTETGLRRVVYELVLTDLLVRHATVFNRRAFVESQLRRLAAHHNTSFAALLRRLVDATAAPLPFAAQSALPAILRTIYRGSFGTGVHTAAGGSPTPFIDGAVLPGNAAADLRAGHGAGITAAIATGSARPLTSLGLTGRAAPGTSANMPLSLAESRAASAGSPFQPVSGSSASASPAPTPDELLYFLRHGSLPALATAEISLAQLHQALAQLLTRAGWPAVRRLLERAGTGRAAATLARYWPEPALQELLRQAVPGHLRPYLQAMQEAGTADDIQHTAAGSLPPGTGSRVVVPNRQRLWEYTLGYVATATPAVANGQSFSHWLEQQLPARAASLGRSSDSLLADATQASEVVRYFLQHGQSPPWLGVALPTVRVARLLHWLARTDQPALRAWLRAHVLRPEVRRRLALLADFEVLARVLPLPTRHSVSAGTALLTLDQLLPARSASGPTALRQFVYAAYITLATAPVRISQVTYRAKLQQLAASYQLPWQALLRWLTGQLQLRPELRHEPFLRQLLALMTAFAGETGATIHSTPQHLLPDFVETMSWAGQRMERRYSSRHPEELPWPERQRRALNLTRQVVWNQAKQLAELGKVSSPDTAKATAEQLYQTRPEVPAVPLSPAAADYSPSRLAAWAADPRKALLPLTQAAASRADSLLQVNPQLRFSSDYAHFAWRGPSPVLTSLTEVTRSRPVTGFGSPTQLGPLSSASAASSASVPIPAAALQTLRALSPTTGAVELVVHWLRHGRLPVWWRSGSIAPAQLRKLLAVAIRGQQSVLRAFLGRYGATAAVQQRLALIADFTLLTALLPARGRSRLAVSALHKRDQDAADDTFTRFVRAAYVAFHFQPTGSTAPQRLAQVRQLAASYRLPWRALLVKVGRLLRHQPLLANEPLFAALQQVHALLPQAQPQPRPQSSPAPLPGRWPLTSQPRSRHQRLSYPAAASEAGYPAAGSPGALPPATTDATRSAALPWPSDFAASASATASIPPNSTSLPTGEAARDLVFYYLLHRQLPWWAADINPPQLRRLLAQVMHHYRSALRQFVQEHLPQHSALAATLASLASFTLLAQLLPVPARLGRHAPASWNPARLDTLLTTEFQASEAPMQLFLKEAYLAFTVENSADTGKLLTATRQRATRYGLSWRAVLRRVQRLHQRLPTLAAVPFFAWLLTEVPAAASRGSERPRPRAASSPPPRFSAPAAVSAWHALEQYLQTGQLPPAATLAEEWATLQQPDNRAELERLRPLLAAPTVRARLLTLLPAPQVLALLRRLFLAQYRVLAPILADWQLLVRQGVVRLSASALLATLLALVQATPAASFRGETVLQALLTAEEAQWPAASRPGPAPNAAARILRDAARLGLVLRGPLPALLTLRQHQQQPKPAASPRPAPADSAGTPYRVAEEPAPLESVYVANAGLVLLWPFLNMLFNRLGYLSGPQFHDAEAAARAAVLLQFLATGDEQAPEFALPLNKLLCGIRQPRPLPREQPLTDEEKSTGESLLRAAIARWEILKTTTISGLRETFLMRQGKLEWLAEDRITLTVEPRPFDMLLDQRPWSISIIKLPWMPLPLYVTWR